MQLYPTRSAKNWILFSMLFLILFLGSYFVGFAQAPVLTKSFPLKTIEPNIDPRGAAITPDGSKAIIAEWERSRVRIIDLSNNTHVFAAAQSRPNDVSVNAQGTFAYVTNFASNSISRINLLDNTSIPAYITSVATIGAIREIEITPDGNTAIASTNQQGTDASSYLVFIDLVNNTILNRVEIPGGANILAMNATGTIIYTVGIGVTGIVSKIDIATQSVLTSFATATSNNVKGLVLSGDGNTLYSLHNNGYVSAYGSLNATAVQLWTELLSINNPGTDYFTNACVIDTNTSRMYFVTHNATGNADQLITIDLINKTKLFVTSAKSWPNSIAISANGKKLMLSLRRNNDAKLYVVPTFQQAGTVGDPFQITNWSQLHSIRDNLAAHYKLMNNLDENSTGYATYASSSSNSAAGWLPIGNASTQFTGSLDGNNFTISAMHINRTSNEEVGLFGRLGAVSLVKNLNMLSASVAGGNKVGILSGLLLGTIRDCSINGVVSGISKVGGIIGESSGTMERCLIKGTVTASSSYAGGAIGFMNSGMVTDAYSLASVNGTDYVGGFGGTIAGSFSRSYSAGTVSGTSITGGYAGSSTASVSKVYWDADASGQLASAAGTSKTTTQIKDYFLFFNDGWDLQCERINGNTDIWGLNNSLSNGYPFLTFENGATGCPEWNAQSTNNFYEINNWDLGFMPSKGMDIVIGADANQDLEIPENWVAGNLLFNNSGVRIILHDNNLVILGNVTNANAQNHIQTNGSGLVKKILANGSTFNFPVGNSIYNPVTITNNTGSSDSLFVRVVDKVLMQGISGTSVTGAFVKRTWDIHKNNANAGAGLNFVFTWNAGDVNSPMASPALFHYENNSWVKQTGITSYNANSLTYTGYTGAFSPFAIAEAASALAMDLKSIKVTCEEGAGMISWSTISANKDFSFYVEKSTDLQNWNLVKMVKSSNSQNYTVRDQQVNASMYYRIRQKDSDGKESISSISKLSCLQSNLISITPVPASNTITIKGIFGQVKYSIIGLHGQVLQSGSINSAQPVISISSLKNGVYYLKINSRGKTSSLKIIVQK